LGQNQFAESLVEIMLSWMRWLTSWFWNIINSGSTGGGFWAWFADSWKSLAVFLIIIGFIVDWLVWMIRWRPYWLWLRKRQIIYEEVTVEKKRPRPAKEDTAEYEDAQDECEQTQGESSEYGDEPADEAPQAAPSPEEDALAEWDSTDDPYSQAGEIQAGEVQAEEVQAEEIQAGEVRADEAAASEPCPPAVPAKKVVLNHSRPVLGERMNHTDVDNGQ